MKKNVQKIATLMVLIVGLVYSSAHSQIAAWQFNNLSTTVAETSVNVSLTDQYLDVSPLTLGAGFKPILIGGNAFGSQPNASTTADLAGINTAVANNDYYGFTLSAKTGYKLSLKDLVVKIRFSSARFLLLRYSFDGANFTDVAPAAALTGSTGGNGQVQPAIDLSGISALQDVVAGTTIYFRLYHSGSNNSTGTTAIGRSLTATEYALSVTGNVEPVIAPNSILAWQFAEPQSEGNEAAFNANMITTGLEPAALVRGPGLRTTSNVGADIVYPGAFVANAVTASVATSAADINDAIANNLYFAFEVKPSANYKVSLSALRTKVRASAGGAKTWLWRYSTDNINFNDIGTPYYNPGTATGGVYMPELDLTAITALQNITPATTIYFRLYLQGSNATTGSSGIGISSDDNGYVLSLDGTVESTLPVKLTSFTGKASGNGVRLNWATASENNNAYFEVLRLKEGKEPLVLGKVLGQGNSSVAKTYTFTDNNPERGTNYYQLRQVDYNGNFELSHVIDVNATLIKSEFAAFFKDDVLNVLYQAEKAGTFELKLFDISGHNIYQKSVRIQAGKNELQAPVILSNGVYVISLAGDNNTVLSKKIIK